MSEQHNSGVEHLRAFSALGGNPDAGDVPNGTLRRVALEHGGTLAGDAGVDVAAAVAREMFDGISEQVTAGTTTAGGTPSVADIFDDEAQVAPEVQVQPEMQVQPSRVARIEAKVRVPWVRHNIDEMLRGPLAPWVVQNYFRTGQLGFLVSFSTVGKSTIAAALTVHVAYGLPWAGNRVRAGSVVAIVGEGRRGFANRFEAYRRHLGLGPLPEGRYVEVVDLKRPLSDPAGQDAVRKLVATVTADRGHAPTLVIIDTLSSHWAASEDAAEFAGPAMRTLGDLAELHGAAVLVLHHVVKGKGLEVMPSLGDVRGSGAFFSNTDFVLAACRSDAGVRLAEIKVKDDELPPELLLIPGSVPLGTDSEGDPVTGHILTPADAAGVFAALPTEAGRQAQQLAEDVEAVVAAVAALGPSQASRAGIRKRIKRGRDPANAMIDAALRAGRIEPNGTGSKARFRVASTGSTRSPINPDRIDLTPPLLGVGSIQVDSHAPESTSGRSRSIQVDWNATPPSSGATSPRSAG